MTLIFKLVPRADWETAGNQGVFKGAPVDLADGFIHFSDADQVRETAAKHFKGQTGLVIAAFDASTFGAVLKWEVSRGGALFPHLYDTLDPAAAVWVKDLPLGPDGLHQFPDLSQ